MRRLLENVPQDELDSLFPYIYQFGPLDEFGEKYMPFLGPRTALGLVTLTREIYKEQYMRYFDSK